MPKERVFLVISADRKVRAAKRPQIRADEVAIAIDLTYPDGWGRVIQALSVDVPSFAPRVDLAEPPEANDG